MGYVRPESVTFPWYWQDSSVAIACGDARDVLAKLPAECWETVIVDPVWPNAAVEMAGRDDPEKLFREICQCFPRSLKRLVVQLGCDSDPRFLRVVPDWLPFLRVCWLDYARPSYKGRLLYTGDVAYVFGVPPAFIPGRQLMLGMCRSSRPDKDMLRHTKNSPHRLDPSEFDRLPHPCARRLEHVTWLVNQFSDEWVIDPMCGSGTTLLAAKACGRHAIGIEISEKFCQVALERNRQGALR